jgi:glycine/D-amino acid oxidase-like deaminating enzyme
MAWTQDRNIFAKDFKAKPYWWEAYAPTPLARVELPREVTVAIVGAGYAGLNAALELARHGCDAIVLDAAEPGFGGSTRNGGMVSGGVNVGKRMLNRALTEAEAAPFLADSADAYDHVEALIADNAIDCGWTPAGYFLGAWCKSHYAAMETKVARLNTHARSDAVMVPAELQRQEIGSDYYHGGMVVKRAAHLHPSLYFKGLLGLVQKTPVPIASQTPVTQLSQQPNGSWLVTTPRGTLIARHVIIASNGYTGDVTPQLKRRVVPVGSYIIATEELPADLAQSLSPSNRSFADTRRVLTYYRMSPDGKRLVFGGRAKFGFSDPVETAPMLHRFMTDRFPQLRGVKITHAWTGHVAFTFDELPHMGVAQGMHYALGCNGSGIAMMSYLGQQTARKVLGLANRRIAFDQPEFPSHPLYHGRPWFLPLVGAWMRTADWLDRRLH